MIENWWADLDTAILECLRNGGPMSPAEIGRRTGVSEGEATVLLTMLIGEGRVRLHLVGIGDQPASRTQTEPGTNKLIPRGRAA